jgi:hypothetical protein
MPTPHPVVLAPELAALERDYCNALCGGCSPPREVVVDASIVGSQRARPIAALTPRVRALVGVALAFLALGWLLGYGIAAATFPHPPSPGPAVARYMAGLQRTDGAEIWASMSPDFRARAIREGDTPESFAAFSHQLKQRGNRIDPVHDVGG